MRPKDHNLGSREISKRAKHTPITLEGKHVRLEPLSLEHLNSEWPQVKTHLEEKLQRPYERRT
ncbi:MAG: hypothetical protein HW389_2463 [Bacteroidetes bacterium]|nr:hypothetical protein [Bacteroidota bacterium]